MRKLFKSIRIKIAFFQGLFLVCVLAIMFIGSYLFFKRIIKGQIFSHTFELVKVEAKELDDYVIKTKRILDSISHEICLIDATHPSEVKGYLASYRHLSRIINSLFVVNAKGYLIASYPSIDKSIGIFTNTKGFKSAIRQKKDFIPTPFFLPTISKPCIVICVPLCKSDKKIKGEVCGAINILDRSNPFGQIIDRKVGNTGYMYLFARDRTLIVHHMQSRILKKDVPPGANKMFDQALKGFEGVGETITSKGLHTFVAFKRMKTTGWILAANYPIKDAFSFFMKFRCEFIIFSIIAILLFVILNLSLTTSIVSPLTELSERIKKISVRDMKEWSSLPESPYKELNIFLTAFNSFLDEIKKSRELLAESEERYRRIIETFPETAFEADIMGKVTFLNSAGQKLFGLTDEDIKKGIFVFDVVHPRYLKQAHVVFKKTIEGKVRDYFEYELINKDKQSISVRGIIYPVEKEGRVVGVCGFAMDISEYKKSKEKILSLNRQLLEANKKLSLFKKAVEFSPLSIVITDRNGIIEYVNPYFYKLTGYSREEAVGKRPNILKSNVHDQGFYKELWNTILSGKEWVGEICNKKKNGELFWERAFIASIRDEKGEISHFVGIKEDITESKKRDEELKNALKRIEYARKKLNAILDMQESIVVLLDKRDMRIIYINKKFFELFSYKDLQDFLSRHRIICELFKDKEGYLPRCKATPQEYLQKNFKNQQSRLAIMEDKWGKEHIFSVHPKEVKIHNEELCIITLMEVTEQEKARQMARRAELSKMEFLANMSHEIRTPLNAIVGFFDLLSRTKLDATQARYVSIIRSSIESLLKIVNSVLDVSKLEAGKLEIEYKKINPYVEFDKILMLFTSLISQKGIKYHYSIDHRLNEGLEVGIQALKQVLMNLIGNAIKFTPAGKDIAVQIVLERDLEDFQQVKFMVKDRGIGINKEKLSIIFDRFSQADSSITRRYGGTGLGLSISYSLVKLMGGDLRVNSVEGKGSCFYFSLKLRKCPVEEKISTLFKGKKVAVYITDNRLQDRIHLFLKHWDIAFDNIAEKHIEQISKIIGKYKAVIASIDKELEICKKIGEYVIFAGIKDIEIADNKIIILEHPFASQVYNALLGLFVENRDSDKIDKRDKIFNLSVLVAEDNSLNRILMEEIFKSYKLDVDFAEDGKTAVDMALSNRYDIIFMDIDMPVMDGIEAASRIKEKRPSVPIIALTAHVLQEVKDVARSMGIDDYLPKPIDREKLEEILEKYQGVKKGQHKKSPETRREGAGDIDIVASMRRAKEELGLSEDSITRLFEKFSESLAPYLKEIEAACKDKDLIQISRIGHSIKGSSSSLRLDVFSFIGRSLEDAAKRGDWDDILGLVAELKDKANYFLDEFYKYKGRKDERS